MKNEMLEKTTTNVLEHIKKQNCILLENFSGNSQQRLRKVLEKLTEGFRSFLKDPNSNQYLSMVKLAMDIILKLILILMSLKD